VQALRLSHRDSGAFGLGDARRPKTRWGVIALAVVGGALILGTWNWSHTGSPTGTAEFQKRYNPVIEKATQDFSARVQAIGAECNCKKIPPTSPL
jgi:hypothetical protein